MEWKSEKLINEAEEKKIARETNEKKIYTAIYQTFILQIRIFVITFINNNTMQQKKIQQININNTIEKNKTGNEQLTSTHKLTHTITFNTVENNWTIVYLG